MRGEPVSAVGLARSGDPSRRVTPKVSGRKFPFPELLCARVVLDLRKAAAIMSDLIAIGLPFPGPNRGQGRPDLM